MERKIKEPTGLVSFLLFFRNLVEKRRWILWLSSAQVTVKHSRYLFLHFGEFS
jgi:hypothetical protein